MRTVLTLVFVFAATDTVALAQPRGNSGFRPQMQPPCRALAQPRANSGVCRYHDGCHPAPRACHNWPTYLGPDYYCDFAIRDDTLFGQPAQVDSTAGYNLLASLARMNEMEMQRLAVENQRERAENQLRLRKMKSELRDAEYQKRKALLREQNAARPHAAQPASVVSPSGAIAWPIFLRDDNYSDYRAKVKELFQQKARTGHVSAADRQQITQTTEKILAELKDNIQNIQPQDYVAVKTFLRGLLTELRKQPSPNNRLCAGGLVVRAESVGE
jgi:hypothetical protein